MESTWSEDRRHPPYSCQVSRLVEGVQLEVDDPGRRSRALIHYLSERIATSGPMPFASFMADALYHPEHGYYTSLPGPWTVTPDFLTAPQMGPALGDAVAELAVAVDGALGRPVCLDLVELGSGDGSLLMSTLTALQRRYPTVWPRLRAWSVERGASGRRRQQEEQRSVPAVCASSQASRTSPTSSAASCTRTSSSMLFRYTG